MLENCNFYHGAIIVVAPGQCISQGFRFVFTYDGLDFDSFSHEVDSAIKRIRKEIRSSLFSNYYLGKTLAVFGLCNYFTPGEEPHFIKFIKIQNVREFKL